MSGMAEVREALVDRIALFLGTNYPCDCGDGDLCSGDETAEADAIVELMEAAGFGPVREAKAQAWDEAFKAGGDWANTCRVWFDDPPTRPRNPYRAASVRGEG